MENKPKKPLILIRQECFNSLVDAINSSGLPAFIIEPMLRDLLSETQATMKAEYESSLKWYDEQCKNID